MMHVQSPQNLQIEIFITDNMCLLSLQQFLVIRVKLDISAVTLMYSHAPHNDVSVKDGPHILGGPKRL